MHQMHNEGSDHIIIYVCYSEAPLYLTKLADSKQTVPCSLDRLLNATAFVSMSVKRNASIGLFISVSVFKQTFTWRSFRG